MKSEKSNRLFYKLGGITCILLIAYSLITMLIMVFIGTPPETIEECFSVLQENRFNGLLRLDILTVFVMPLYYLLFYSLYLALKNTDKELVTISTILVFAGLTLFLASPSVFSYLHLSDKYATAVTEAEKNQLISAGQAILASDMWHGTGARIGGILIQLGALLVSVVMIKGNVFNKLTAWTGIITHGLDFAHIIIGFFLPTWGVVLMAIAGPLYLLWFPLVGVRFFKLNRE
ncbi:hypothetical protein [uncultured Draconibacterium sp.]|uniref:hypothetical protein n=1 Tax=uncultured Draconibacterium sp. TaxID=1573823 RepID=UPI0029C6F00E|nr:hypothetical protein [uncultured Draconibacterium sp.]